MLFNHFGLSEKAHMGLLFVFFPIVAGFIIYSEIVSLASVLLMYLKKTEICKWPFICIATIPIVYSVLELYTGIACYFSKKCSMVSSPYEIFNGAAPWLLGFLIILLFTPGKLRLPVILYPLCLSIAVIIAIEVPLLIF
ncbi:hypothetical protein JXI42_13360 [bacterium]|nr:hypothetical protein [bacterium]